MESDKETYQMKLRSGTSLDTAPEVLRLPSQANVRSDMRNFWSDVASLYTDDKLICGPAEAPLKSVQPGAEFPRPDWFKQVSQADVSPAVCLRDRHGEKESVSPEDLNSDSRIRTRSGGSNPSRVSLFSTLKYELSSDGSSNGKIPKLTIRKRQIEPSHSNAPSCDMNRTKRLKLILGKEAFHINLNK